MYLQNLLRYFDIRSELESHDIIRNEIVKGITFKGTNLWILFFAILVASVGLNVNSTAVIIGAMLISPLMGPINGIGYSIATYDFRLFSQAIKNLGFAISISLLASTTYFLVSPISTAHSELLARTTPTFYDVMIALFGGLAGIVAISSKQKGNVIPGAAIATALMPPLCTAGYGIASGQLLYFLGALHLFVINCVFIATSAFIVSRVLKFPLYRVVDASAKKRINSYITFIMVLVLVPTIYFTYTLLRQDRFRERAGHYIESVSSFEGNYLLNSEINAGNRTIRLIYGGVDLTDSQKEEIIRLAKGFDLKNPEIIISQGIAFNPKPGLSESERLQEEVSNLNRLVAEKQNKLDAMEKEKALGSLLLSELRIFYPEIVGCSCSSTEEYLATGDAPAGIMVVVYITQKGRLSAEKRDAIQKWTVKRLSDRQTRVLFSEK